MNDIESQDRDNPMMFSRHSMRERMLASCKQLPSQIVARMLKKIMKAANAVASNFSVSMFGVVHTQ